MSDLATIASGIRTLLLPLCPNITLGPLQATTPDPCLGLVVYPGTDDDTTAVYEAALQIAIRVAVTAGAKPVLDLGESIHDAICYPDHLDFGDVTVTLAWRQSATPVQLDAQGRPFAWHNYRLVYDRQEL